MKRFLLVLGFLGICENNYTEVVNSSNFNDFGSVEYGESEKLSEIGDSTVALVLNNGNIYPFCGGVWVSQNVLITAHHCIKDFNEFNTGKARVNNGDNVTYVNFHEFSHKKHYKINIGKVMDSDEYHDLALVRVNGNVSYHKVAEVEQSPMIGENLFVVGHPLGNFWQYVPGTVLDYPQRVDSKDDGPFLKISGKIKKGFSGCGAFDSDGNLAGISSFIYSNIPDVGFFITTSHIKELMNRNSL